MAANTQRTTLGECLQIPFYRRNEQILGYETDMIFSAGLFAQNVQYIKVQSTRKTTPYINQFIMTRWNEVKSKNPQAFDAPRARFEGSFYDESTKLLKILWSDAIYSMHAALRDTILPKPYQANLFTINGIPFPKDEKIPIFWRNPKKTDQGRIKHISPAGFIDVHNIKDKLVPETVEEATIRNLLRELSFPGSNYMETPFDTTDRELGEELSVPEGVFKAEDMKILGIVYNFRRNFDYTSSVLIPLDCESTEIKVKGDEHEEGIDWVNANLETLKSTLFELAMAPETNSGHLRGDVALMICHLFGKEKYEEVLEESVLEISKLK
jgi:hypothetical protein